MLPMLILANPNHFIIVTPKYKIHHTTNRLAAHANEKGPVTGGCPISSMVTVNIHGQQLYRELNLYLFCDDSWLERL